MSNSQDSNGDKDVYRKLKLRTLFDSVGSLNLQTTVIDSESYIEGWFSLVAMIILLFFEDARGEAVIKMRKDRIKIIKRINIGKVVEKINAPANMVKIESETQIKVVRVVKDWINERNENNRIEKLFSEHNISNWKIAS